MYRPVNHGYIELVIGPMYSGKSEELIRRLKRAKIAYNTPKNSPKPPQNARNQNILE